MKKLISLLLSFTLLIPNLNLIALASESKEVDYAQILIDRGYPASIVEDMPYEDIVYQAENGFVYHTTIEEAVSLIPVGGNESEVEMAKLITDMRISFNISYKWNTNKQLTEMYVSVSYRWDIMTVYNYTDAWGVAWDHQDFRYKSGTYSGKTMVGTYDANLNFNETVHTTYGTLAKTEPSFIGGYVDQIFYK